MTRNAFGRLCQLLEFFGGLRATRHVTIMEQVATFLSIIAHHKKNCVVKHDFVRSGSTISKHFHSVLMAVLRLHPILLPRPAPIQEGCQDHRWRWFKGCLGALDGTHVDTRVPEVDKGRYRNRKGQISINVLGVCSTDGKFTYVLSGWEGSAADSRVLRHAITKPHGLKVPIGNYYLCDNGYSNSEGFLTPYRGVRYHLRDYDRGSGGPQNKEELFNLRHSSAHNVIERTFGLLKTRWGILRSPSYYTPRTHTRIIMACCLLHNFLLMKMPDDPIVNETRVEVDNKLEEGTNFVSTVEATTAWSRWRDELASNMYNEWLNGG
ncbi:UNVERIFIED_CONTAM: putative nuclease HARBI1 [Sesamum radiatum]|uniref:Nuclease HARBI1 n=1 Tax=Sesamum radiatum TaxID=300843 RepID=A0AAW2VM19_SESRA